MSESIKRLGSSAFEALLNKIRETAAAGDDPLVVLDLDGTLYDNTYRTLRIIQEFAHVHALEHPELLKALEGATASKVRYLVAETLAEIGITEEALVEKIVAFWRDRFFTNDYCLYDLPLAGAKEAVQRIVDAGGVPCYLTGRDAPNMLIGTLKSLQRDGFPVGRVDTRIILKPDFETPDATFKEGVIANLKKTGVVCASFDNEPGLCNLFKENFPEATVGWLATGNAPGAPEIRQDIVTLRDFTDLL